MKTWYRSKLIEFIKKRFDTKILLLWESNTEQQFVRAESINTAKFTLSNKYKIQDNKIPHPQAHFYNQN